MLNMYCKNVVSINPTSQVTVDNSVTKSHLFVVKTVREIFENQYFPNMEKNIDFVKYVSLLAFSTRNSMQKSEIQSY